MYASVKDIVYSITHMCVCINHTKGVQIMAAV